MLSRELEPKEIREIRKLATQTCANYDEHYKLCLPLDCSCYMFNIAYTNSPLCKYFRNCLLPLNPQLEAVFSNGIKPDEKSCAICGKDFVSRGRQAYCSEKCKLEGNRIKSRKRMMKMRKK